jgi:alpha-beta hydrolase superfamily lysophospholipase
MDPAFSVPSSLFAFGMRPFFPSRRDTLSTSDGIDLHVQWKTPADPPRAVVLLVHGYAEHCGRHGVLATTFAETPALVCAYDQRGYGRSGGRRAYVDTFDQYLDDLARVVDTVRARVPELPLFLFGHSMGGLVVLKYVLDRSPSAPAGLLLSAPALEVNPDLAPILRRMAHLLGRLAPRLPTVRSPDGALSRDPAVVEQARTDPLNYHGRIPARTGAELLRAGESVRARLEEVEHPFLVLHGTDDPLASPVWSRRLYERARAADKTLKLYEGRYHESFHDFGRDAVLADLADWLGARVG